MNWLNKHPRTSEFICGVLLFTCIFGVMWLAIDTLASSKGDYVGHTPTVIKK